MAEEAESRHICRGMDSIFPADLSRCFIQCRHGLDCPCQMLRGSFPHPIGGTDEPHAQCFGQDKLVSGPPGVIGIEVVRIYQARDREAVLDSRVCNGMPSCKDPARFGDFFRTAAQDLSQNVQIHALRETDKVQRRLHFAAHCINITEGVGGRDLPERVRVIYHRRKEVHGLYQCDILRDFINGGIVPAVVADQQIQVFLAPGQLFQDTAQHSCTKLCGTAAACTENDLLSVWHLGTLPFRKCCQYHRDTIPHPQQFFGFLACGLALRRIGLVEYRIKMAHPNSLAPALFIGQQLRQQFRRQDCLRRNAQQCAGRFQPEADFLQRLSHCGEPCHCQHNITLRQQHRFMSRRGLAGQMLCAICFQKDRVCLRHPAFQLRRLCQFVVRGRGSCYRIVATRPESCKLRVRSGQEWFFRALDVSGSGSQHPPAFAGTVRRHGVQQGGFPATAHQ